jgi:hypothetical protein
MRSYVPGTELALLALAVRLASHGILNAAHVLRARVPCSYGRTPLLWVLRRHSRTLNTRSVSGKISDSEK